MLLLSDARDLDVFDWVTKAVFLATTSTLSLSVGESTTEDIKCVPKQKKEMQMKYKYQFCYIDITTAVVASTEPTFRRT